MRVLYLCHRVPYPPNKGEKIRAFQQLRAMAAAGHEVDLFTLADDPGDMAEQSRLASYCREVTVVRLNRKLSRIRALPFLLTSLPLTVPYFSASRLHKHVRSALRKRSYDRIFVYCSAMAQYVDEIADDTPIITDLVDVDSDKWRQYASYASLPFSAIYRREASCLQEYERRVCSRSASVIVTTEREATLLRETCDGANVHVIGVGVDTELFGPTKVGPAPPLPAIVFVGDMSYFPNEQAVTFFARDVLPRIQTAIPDVRFMIVGRNPTSNVRKLSGIRGVEVTGAVPDVRPYLAKAHVAVAPFAIAAGIQTKILEAMASGLPIVATSRAAQGLSANVAAAVAISDTVEQLASSVVYLLANPQIARSKGAESQRRVASDYSWSRMSDQLTQLLDAPNSRPGKRPAAQSAHT